jgi:hypothetical protein
VGGGDGTTAGVYTANLRAFATPLPLASARRALNEPELTPFPPDQKKAEGKLSPVTRQQYEFARLPHHS